MITKKGSVKYRYVALKPSVLGDFDVLEGWELHSVVDAANGFLFVVLKEVK